MQPSKPNPASARKVTRENRVPMSVPVAKLAVPELPGYKIHWMRNDEARIQQAFNAGYTFVTREDLQALGASIVNRDVAGSPLADGSNDLGSRITVNSGSERYDDGAPVRLVLMKLPAEFAEDDKKKHEAAQEAVVEGLRVGDAGKDKSPLGADRSRRYAGEANGNIFQRRIMRNT